MRGHMHHHARSSRLGSPRAFGHGGFARRRFHGESAGDAIGQADRRAEGGPARRAIHTLRTMLRERAAREAVADATLHDIAAILDDAARRIERL